MCLCSSGGCGSAPGPVASLPRGPDCATSPSSVSLLGVSLGGHSQQVHTLFSKKHKGFSSIGPPAKVSHRVSRTGGVKLRSKLPPNIHDFFQATGGGRNILFFWAPQKKILAAGDADPADVLCNSLTHDF